MEVCNRAVCGGGGGDTGEGGNKKCRGRVKKCGADGGMEGKCMLR